MVAMTAVGMTGHLITGLLTLNLLKHLFMQGNRLSSSRGLNVGPAMREREVREGNRQTEASDRLGTLRLRSNPLTSSLDARHTDAKERRSSRVISGITDDRMSCPLGQERRADKVDMTCVINIDLNIKIYLSGAKVHRAGDCLLFIWALLKQFGWLGR